MAGGYNPFGTALGGLTGGLLGQGIQTTNQTAGIDMLGTQTVSQTVWFSTLAQHYAGSSLYYQVIATTGTATTVNYYGAYPPEYFVQDPYPQIGQVNYANRLSEEEIRAQQQVIEEAERISAAEAEARQSAGERARLLLERFLSESQLEQWRAAKCFEVESQQKNLYRLRWGTPKVCRIDTERRDTISYCIHTYDVPPCDELLGFKLMLEMNEAHFLATANPTRLR